MLFRKLFHCDTPSRDINVNAYDNALVRGYTYNIWTTQKLDPDYYPEHTSLTTTATLSKEDGTIYGSKEVTLYTDKFVDFYIEARLDKNETPGTSFILTIHFAPFNGEVIHFIWKGSSPLRTSQ